jgi:hypothetical protein
LFSFEMLLNAGSTLEQTGQHWPGMFLTSLVMQGRTGQLFLMQDSLPPVQVHSLQGSVMSALVSLSMYTAPARVHPGQEGQEPGLPWTGFEHMGAGQGIEGVVVIIPEKHS